MTLGPATLNRKWRLEVNTGTDAAPTWTRVYGMTEFQPSSEPTMQDDSDFDSDGYKSEAKTADKWSCSLKVARKTVAAAPTTYDPGQESLRNASNQMGVSNVREIRFYEMEPGGPRIEAYQGKVAVSWSPDGGGMDALDLVSVTLSGRGKRNAITHPSP